MSPGGINVITMTQADHRYAQQEKQGYLFPLEDNNLQFTHTEQGLTINQLVRVQSKCFTLDVCVSEGGPTVQISHRSGDCSGNVYYTW